MRVSVILAVTLSAILVSERSAAHGGNVDSVNGTYPNPGTVFRDIREDGRPCPECPEMVVVPRGQFVMGSDDPQLRDRTMSPRAMVIDYEFAVGRFEVTFDEWDACVAAGGCNGYRPSDRSWGRGRRPVIFMSWDDAQSYVQWLSAHTGQRYRLLTNTEWEYVDRSGTTTRYWWGDQVGSGNANCADCGSIWDNTAPVGSFNPNAFGAFDTTGNVYEIVLDGKDHPRSWSSEFSPADSRGGSYATHSTNIGGAAGSTVAWRHRETVLNGCHPETDGFRVARVIRSKVVPTLEELANDPTKPGPVAEVWAAAAAGEAEAQFTLGAWFERSSDGAEANMAEAVTYYRKAAEQGHANAQYQLGRIYEFGLGVKQSDQEAFAWYEKAAAVGHGASQYSVAVMYRDGLGVVRDQSKWQTYLEMAARSGNPEAQFAMVNVLGQYIQAGSGPRVLKDIGPTLTWWERAADQRFRPAMAGLFVEYGNRYEVFGSEQDLEAAIHWGEKLLSVPRENGWDFLQASPVYRTVGMAILRRFQDEDHRALGLKFLKLSIEPEAARTLLIGDELNGHTWLNVDERALYTDILTRQTGADFNLELEIAKEFWSGNGILRSDHEEAERWLLTAWNRSSWSTDDFDQAAVLIRGLAEEDRPASQYIYATVLYHGRGVAKDTRAAAGWFRKSAEHGYVPAQAE